MTEGKTMSRARLRFQRLAVGRALPRLMGAAGVLLLLFLGLYNQPSNPIPWLDEGFAAQGAMNLLRYGEYAMRSSEGFRVLDQPLVANGPGFVLPVATVFSLLGVGLFGPRLGCALFYSCSVRILHGWAKALRGCGRAALGGSASCSSGGWVHLL